MNAKQQIYLATLKSSWLICKIHENQTWHWKLFCLVSGAKQIKKQEIRLNHKSNFFEIIICPRKIKVRLILQVFAIKINGPTFIYNWLANTDDDFFEVELFKCYLIYPQTSMDINSYQQTTKHLIK